MRSLYLSISLFLIISQSTQAQVDVAFPTQSVNYKIVEDNPRDLNHLWIHVQPVTIDAMQLNAIIGSGLEVTYLPIPKLELKGGIRGNLINSFDLQRTAGLNGAFITAQSSKREQLQMHLTNSFSRFYSFEIGGMYNLMEKDKDGSSKMVLSDNAVPGNTGFPEVIEVNAKSRQIWGVRLGVSSIATTASLQSAISRQNITLIGSNGTRLSKEGTASPSGFQTIGNNNEIFSNFSSSGIYIGGALQMIKNISIKTDRQGIVSNNSIVTVYADFMLNHWTSLEAIKTSGESFSADPVKLNKMGGRLGADVRYNQASYLSVGAELGYRPSIQGQGWYAQIKLSIPTFSFGASKGKVASNVGQNQSLTQ